MLHVQRSVSTHLWSSFRFWIASLPLILQFSACSTTLAGLAWLSTLISTSGSSHTPRICTRGRPRAGSGRTVRLRGSWFQCIAQNANAKDAALYSGQQPELHVTDNHRAAFITHGRLQPMHMLAITCPIRNHRDPHMTKAALHDARYSYKRQPSHLLSPGKALTLGNHDSYAPLTSMRGTLRRKRLPPRCLIWDGSSTKYCSTGSSM